MQTLNARRSTAREASSTKSRRDDNVYYVNSTSRVGRLHRAHQSPPVAVGADPPGRAGTAARLATRGPGPQRGRNRQFSFKSVGIQAQGRTTILKINYRNTRQILKTASLIAADLLSPEERDDDGIPLLRPVSCGRDGHEPTILRLPNLKEEARQIAELLGSAHQEGRAWNEMAIICRRHAVMDECASALRRRRLPHQVRKGAGSFDPAADSIKIMTMHASKGLEFPVVALPGVGHMPEAGESDADEARLFYVAATRATETLIITLSGTGAYMDRLGA